MKKLRNIIAGILFALALSLAGCAPAGQGSPNDWAAISQVVKQTGKGR